LLPRLDDAVKFSELALRPEFPHHQLALAPHAADVLAHESLHHQHGPLLTEPQPQHRAPELHFLLLLRRRCDAPPDLWCFWGVGFVVGGACRLWWW
jgi:hypothetical protein